AILAQRHAPPHRCRPSRSHTVLSMLPCPRWWSCSSRRGGQTVISSQTPPPTDDTADPTWRDPRISENLATLEATFKRNLYMPDTGNLRVVLATYVANHLPGPPLWVLSEDGSGKGKTTQLIEPLESLPHMHTVSTVTEAALLSGSSAKDRAEDATGGLLR